MIFADRKIKELEERIDAIYQILDNIADIQSGQEKINEEVLMILKKLNGDRKTLY